MVAALAALGGAPAPDPAPEPAPQPEPAPPAPAETVAPTAAITSPADRAVVSGVVTVRATASDDVGIVSVQFYANGTLIGTAQSAPYSVSWNTKRLSGSFVLTAVAHDAAGNTTTSQPVTVTIGTTKTPPKK